MLGAGSGTRTLESKMQRLGACTPSRCLVGRLLAVAGGGFVGGLRRDPAGLGGLEVGHQTRLDELRLLTFHAEALGIGVEPDDTLAEGGRPCSQALQLALGPLRTAAQRTQLAANLGCGAGR